MTKTDTPVPHTGEPHTGWLAPDFRLPATDGRNYAMGDLAGKNGLLLMFICNHCPYVKAIADRIARDGKDLADMHVGVAAICANDAANYPEDSFDHMGAFARMHGFSFPYLHDETQQVAHAYGAVCTPDFFGFNAGLALEYRGRLDASGPRPGSPDLRRELYEAMQQTALTGKGPTEQTPSIGCSIKWKETR